MIFPYFSRFLSKNSVASKKYCKKYSNLTNFVKLRKEYRLLVENLELLLRVEGSSLRPATSKVGRKSTKSYWKLFTFDCWSYSLIRFLRLFAGFNRGTLAYGKNFANNIQYLHNFAQYIWKWSQVANFNFYPFLFKNRPMVLIFKSRPLEFNIYKSPWTIVLNGF